MKNTLIAPETYPAGTRLLCNGIRGTVIENVKLPGDICVKWDHAPDAVVSYDADWLDSYAIVINKLTGPLEPFEQE